MAIVAMALFVLAAVGWGLVLVRLARWAVYRVRVVLDRPHPQIDLMSSGTQKAVLEIAHFGAPLQYRAEGRVTRVLNPDDLPHPPEHRFMCEIQPEPGRPSGTRVRLRDGEWAHIIIAESNKASIHDDGHVLWVRRGSYGRQSRGPDSGVEVEYTVHTDPPIHDGPIRRTVRVVRNDNRTVTATPVG